VTLFPYTTLFRSIAERIKANNELGLILDKQAKAEKATIQQRINSLQQEQNLLGVTQERYNEIYQLQTQLLAVDAKITGQQSEQLTNLEALKNEGKDLVLSEIEGTNERLIAQKEFEAEIAKTEEERIQKQKEAIQLQIDLSKEDIERKRLLYAEDTQARVDAEQEYLTKKQELDNQLILNDKALAEEQKRIAKEKADKEIELEEALKNAKFSIAGQTLDLISQLAGEGTELTKGIAVAQATISGIEGVQNAYTTAQKSPITIGFPAYPIVQAGLAGAFSALQIKKILSTPKSGAGGSSNIGAGGGGQVPQAPSFNVVSGTGSNQIAESLATERQPVKAFVVASEMTSQQALERNIQSEASI
jgi:hypothetical protein